MTIPNCLHCGLALGAALSLAVGAAAAPSGARRFTDQLLSTPEGQNSYVSMAYNDQAKEYLIAWDMGGDVFGQRLDLYGLPVGDAFPIHYAEFYAYHTAVAFTSHENRYLVVWDQLGNGYDVHGQLVSADGRLLDNPTTPQDESDPESSFVIAGMIGRQDDETEPQAACDGQSCLVAWAYQAGDGPRRIQATVVGADGSVRSKPLELSPLDGVARSRPRVQFHDETNEYLVVYERGASADTGGQIAARRVLASGQLPGEEFVVAGPEGLRAPDVSGQGAEGFVVVYVGDGTGKPHGVYARTVVAGRDGVVSQETSIGAGGAACRQPRLSFAGMPATGLVVWEDDRTRATSGPDIRGRRLSPEAQPVGDVLAITMSSADDGSPAIGSSSAPAGFLVAWHRQQGNMSDLYGQRVSTLGSLVGAEFGLAARPGPQHQPVVAYNLDDEQFLAVWADDTDHAIRARRLDASGLPLEAPWTVDADGYNSDPAVLYHDVRGHYVVLWSDTERQAVEVAVVGRGGTAIAKTVAGSGIGHHPRLAWEAPEDRLLAVWEVSGDITAAALNGDGTPTRGGICRVAEGAANQAHPDVVYDSVAKRFLAVWEEQVGGGHDVYGRFVSRACQPLSAPLCLAGCADEADHIAPTLSFDPKRNEFLLLHARSDDPRSVTLVGRRLDAEGRPMGGDIPVAPEPTERHAQIRLQARAVYSAAAGSHFVVWPQWGIDGARMDLYTRWLGLPPGTTTPPRLFLHVPGDQYAPVAALAGEGDRVLVAWTDGRRAGGLDVYSRYLSLDVTPPTARLSIDPMVGIEGTTFTLSAEASTDDSTPASLLEARWDFDGDGSWDTAWGPVKTMTRTLAVAGIYTVTVQVVDRSALTDGASGPLLVVPATENRPPLARLRIAPDRGPAGTVFQLDASASSDGETPAAELSIRWDYEADGSFDTDWSVEKTSQWTLTEAGSHTVRLLVRDGGGLTASASGEVIVDPSDLVRLTVVPAFAVVAPREVVRFVARGADSYGNEIAQPSVRWSLADPSLGEIDAGGVFVAGLQTGLFRDAVRVTAGTAADAASLRFVWPHRVVLPWALVEQ